jgi:hypothetical protein
VVGWRTSLVRPAEDRLRSLSDSGIMTAVLDTSWQALLQPGLASDFFPVRPRPFDPETVHFDVANAYWLAELSRLVYRDDAPGRRPRAAFLADVGLTELAFVERDGSAFMLVGPQAAAVPFTIAVFRGTRELRNWVTNLHALPARWNAGGQVHAGFRRALGRVWRPLRRLLAGRDGPLFGTGHSLGGALAMLAGSLLRPRGVYTFGAPRVGDAAFAATLGPIAYELVHGKDLVPHLPPGGPPLRACAAGRRLLLSSDGRLVDAERAADAVAADVAGAYDRRWYEPQDFLSDHAPVNYTARLRQLL